MKPSKIILILLLSIWIIQACQPVEEIIEETPNDTANVLSAKIDGVEFSVKGILVDAEYSRVNEMVQTLSIGGAKAPFNDVTEGLVLAVVSADSSGIFAGETYTSTSLTKVGGGEYVFDDNTIKIKAVSDDDTHLATITITAIDYTKKVVSGTFSFDAVDDNNPSKVYQVRDGVFTDVSFE